MYLWIQIIYRFWFNSNMEIKYFCTLSQLVPLFFPFHSNNMFLCLQFTNNKLRPSIGFHFIYELQMSWQMKRNCSEYWLILWKVIICIIHIRRVRVGCNRKRSRKEYSKKSHLLLSKKSSLSHCLSTLFLIKYLTQFVNLE